MPDSYEHERKVLVKKISDLTYDNIVSELNQKLESWIQSNIRRSSRLMNSFPLMNKMSRTLT